MPEVEALPAVTNIRHVENKWRPGSTPCDWSFMQQEADQREQEAREEVLRRRLCQDGVGVRVQLLVGASPVQRIVAGGRQRHLKQLRSPNHVASFTSDTK
jgi:hypothetical protein